MEDARNAGRDPGLDVRRDRRGGLGTDREGLPQARTLRCTRGAVAQVLLHSRADLGGERTLEVLEEDGANVGALRSLRGRERPLMVARSEPR